MDSSDCSCAHPPASLPNRHSGPQASKHTSSESSAVTSHIPGPHFRTVKMPQHNALKGNRENFELGSERWSKAAKNVAPGLSLLQRSSASLGRPVSVGSRSGVEASLSDQAQLVPKMENKLYRRRWLMLFLFSAVSASNASMWLQYGIISNIFMRFYNIDSLAIDWLSMIYLLTYIPLILPVLWLLENRGIRDVVLVGSAFNCIGAWIKIGSASPSMFPVTFFGQFVCSVATVFFLGIPSYLASVWFGEKEVSTACSIGVLGNQVCLIYFSCTENVISFFCSSVHSGHLITVTIHLAGLDAGTT